MDEQAGREGLPGRDVRQTALAARCIARDAARELRDLGCAEDDPALLDALTATLLIDELLVDGGNLEGDLAEGTAVEALAMARGALLVAADRKNRASEKEEVDKVPSPSGEEERCVSEAEPDSSTPAPTPKRSHAARTTCIALLVVLVVMGGLVAAAWFGVFRLPDALQQRINLLPDAHAQQGGLNAADVDVAPGSFQLVLDQVCTMEAGSRFVPLAFENPEANGYGARIELVLNGEVVASSGMVLPGWRVPTVQIDRDLEPGTYEASAVVLVYSGATQVNTLSSDVTIRVK